MNNIKVSILGADGYICQISRIKEGMEALGHTLSKDSPAASSRVRPRILYWPKLFTL